MTQKKSWLIQKNNLLPYYPKEYALREQTQLYPFTELKIVHNNSDNNQKEIVDTNCLPQILKTKDTRQKSREKNRYLKNQEKSEY